MKTSIVSILVILLVCGSSASAYPHVDFRSVSEDNQQKFTQAMKSIDEEHYQKVNKIIVYGMEIWERDGWYTDGGYLSLDKGSLYSEQRTRNMIMHELTHSKCYQKEYGWDLSHDSKCFTEGLV